MALDGEKLRRIRTSKGISQEKLALMCNVNKRTIQRAEKGDPVALETAAFIAEAVGVTSASLREVTIEVVKTDDKEWNEVVLVPMTSGRRIVDTIRKSFEAELSFDVEPSMVNIEPLANLAKLLEPFVPMIWETPNEWYDPSRAEVLQKQAEVNEVLSILSGLGVTVFAATYTSRRQHPRYDYDEGHMYVTERTPYERSEIALVVVSDTTASHLMRVPTDIIPEWGEEILF